MAKDKAASTVSTNLWWDRTSPNYVYLSNAVIRRDDRIFSLTLP